MSNDQLRLSVQADVSRAQRALRDLSGSLRQVSKSSQISGTIREFKQLEESVLRAGRAMRSGITPALGAVGIGAGGAIASVIGLSKALAGLSDAAIDLDYLSKSSGLATKSLKALEDAGARVNLSGDQIKNAISQFSRLMGELRATPGKALSEAAQNGMLPAMKELQRFNGDSEKQIRRAFEMIDSVRRNQSQQDAEEFARNLFGDPSAARMTLNQYLDSLKKVRPQTEENLKRAREFKDKVVDLNNALGELKNTAGRDLIPVFTRLAEQFTHFLEGEGGQRIANEIGKIAKALGDPENWTKAEEGIKGVGSGFVTIADAISKVSSVFGALPEPLRNALIGAAIGGRVAGPAGAVAGAVTGAGVGNDPLTNLQEHERAQTGATEKLKAFKKALEDFINGLGLAKQMSYMGGGGGAARIMQASLGGGGFGGARLMPASFSPSGAPFGTGGGTSPSFPFGGGRGQGSSPFGSGGGGGAGSSDAAQRIRGAAQSNGEGTMVGPNGETMTFYAPGAGGKMEGGFETSQPNKEGQNIPRTLDDLRSGNSDYVSVASDPSRYGQSVPLGTVTYRSPKDGKMYTLNNVNGYIHDTGSAFKGRPDKLDIASGDYRGWSGSAASAHVLGNSVVRPGGGMDAGGGPVAPGAVTAVGGGDPSAFIMHHTSGRGTVAGVQATLRQRGLGVQYVMDRDGNIVQTGGPGAAHMMSGSSKYGTNLAKRLGLSNKNVVGMEVIAKNDKDVTPAQIAAARDFIAKNYPNTPMFGHGEVNRHKETDEGMSIVNTIRNARAAGLGSPNLFSQRARSERLNRSLANSERALTARGRLDVSVKAPPGTSVKASGEGLFTNTHMERSVSRPNTPQGPTEPTSRGGDGGGEE